MKKRENYFGLAPYNPPEKLITAEEYRKKVTALGESRNQTFATPEFLDELETLRDDLYDMIVYDGSSLPVSGTKYYLSNNGDDNNDGLSPKSAWKTLEKAAKFEFREGDGLYLKRGDLWHGNLPLQNGVTYQAYGEGAKPKIYNSYDGKTAAEWIKTEIPNVWVFNKVLDTMDIGLIVFDDSKKYGEKRMQKAGLQNELDFFFSGKWTLLPEEGNEYKVYLYCTQGNPAEVFDSIELSRQGHAIPIENYQHDITVHNLDIRYGQDYFLNDYSKNIILSYCIFAWMGGHYGGDSANNGCYRFGGGGGAWRTCDNMKFEHCFFTQHFDCAATPQFSCNHDKIDPFTLYNFKKFHVSDCLIEYTEYSFEYFARACKEHSRLGTPGFFDMYFGYNICRKSNKGFGDKHSSSRFIRAGFSENNCFDSVFEKNIFDRSGALAIEISAFRGDYMYRKVSYELMPKLKANIYIDPKDKQFALVYKILYNFNDYSKTALEKLGVEKDSVYIYLPENQKIK